MRSALVCTSVLLLAMGLTTASPLSAQRVDTRFSGTKVSPRLDAAPLLGRAEARRIEGGALEATVLGRRSTRAIPLQQSDSTPGSSGAPFWKMAMASSLGGGTGMLLMRASLPGRVIRTPDSTWAGLGWVIGSLIGR